MQKTNFEAVIKKCCERESGFRWWFTEHNVLEWTGTFADSGVTINESDVIRPPLGRKPVTIKSKEELCNRARITAPADVDSDWKEDSTSIADYGVRQKEIPEPIITDKLILDDMATQYVADHKDIEPNIRGLTIEYDARSIFLRTEDGDLIWYFSKGLKKEEIEFLLRKIHEEEMVATEGTRWTMTLDKQGTPTIICEVTKSPFLYGFIVDENSALGPISDELSFHFDKILKI